MTTAEIQALMMRDVKSAAHARLLIPSYRTAITTLLARDNIKTFAEQEARIAELDRRCEKLVAMLEPEKHRPSWEHEEYARAVAAEVDALRAKLAIMEEDMCAAAGELLVPLPQPGSIDAKLLIANRLLKAEIAELRGKLDDVRMGIGCARGQRSTQFCAEAAQRDEVITKLLAMLEPDEHESACAHPNCHTKRNFHARACEIAGRTE